MAVQRRARERCVTAAPGAFMDGKIVTYRVPCPRCGEYASLRCYERRDHRPAVEMFSCRNQTSVEHGGVILDELRALILA